jgi:hypothetical protein
MKIGLIIREPQEKNDPYKTQKYGGGLRPPPYFWVQLILETVKAGQAWICDRNFCTKDFLTGISERRGYFIVREHLNLKWTEITARQEVGKNDMCGADGV